jgi:hypothetical protein
MRGCAAPGTQQSRAATRVDEARDPVLLADQERSRWNRHLIEDGLTELARAESSRAPWPSICCRARAHLLQKLGRLEEARLESARGPIPSPIEAFPFQELANLRDIPDRSMEAFRRWQTGRTLRQ